MKKIICMMMCILTVMSVSACGKSDDTDSKAAVNVQEKPAEKVTTTTEEPAEKPVTEPVAESKPEVTETTVATQEQPDISAEIVSMGAIPVSEFDESMIPVTECKEAMLCGKGTKEWEYTVFGWGSNNKEDRCYPYEDFDGLAPSKISYTTEDEPIKIDKTKDSDGFEFHGEALCYSINNFGLQYAYECGIVDIDEVKSYIYKSTMEEIPHNCITSSCIDRETMDKGDKYIFAAVSESKLGKHNVTDGFRFGADKATVESYLGEGCVVEGSDGYINEFYKTKDKKSKKGDYIIIGYKNGEFDRFYHITGERGLNNEGWNAKIEDYRAKGKLVE